jgi:HEAT repeat protein
MSEPHPVRSGGDGAPDAFSPAGVLVKLILLPGLVVLCLVMIVVVLAWLTLSPGDVDAMVDALEKGGNTRWRAAVNLAGALRAPGGAALKQDPLLAARLIEILDREIEAARMHEDAITLRMYLCRALGEFHLPEPLPVLIEAATTDRDPREADVRRSAIEAIAVLASNVGPSRLRSDPKLIAALQKAAEDARPTLRSAAAFTLGVIGGPKAAAELETLLSDPYPDVRYNAATGLARHGNVQAVDVLLEMLDPSEQAGVEVEKQEPARESKRTAILVNALRATAQLASANARADLSRIERAIERLTQSHVDGAIRAEAVEVLSQLRQRDRASDLRS